MSKELEKNYNPSEIEDPFYPKPVYEGDFGFVTWICPC